MQHKKLPERRSHSDTSRPPAVPAARRGEKRLRQASAKWSITAIADAVAAGLVCESARFDAEQAVYGLDSLDELALHPLIASALRDAGFGVYREQRYPADRRCRRVSEGERCDLVLTPAGRPLDAPEEPKTLFDPPDAVSLGDAFWLETKVVAQFTANGPNRRYSSLLLGDVRRDVAKLAKDPGIRHAGLGIVLFTAEQHVADHDLAAWQQRCDELELPVAAPEIRHARVSDRLGNEVCTVALFPIARTRIARP